MVNEGIELDMVKLEMGPRLSLQFTDTSSPGGFPSRLESSGQFTVRNSPLGARSEPEGRLSRRMATRGERVIVHKRLID